MATLRERTVFADQGLTVTVIESLELRTTGTRRRCFTTGNLEPIAVIVREPDRTYAIDMAAQPVDIDRMELPVDFELQR